MALIECVPNVSEGRRPDVIRQIADVVRAVSSVRFLDCSSDWSHHRSVLTFVGDGRALKEAVVALFESSVARIDLRTHSGEHPRLGAVDVVPFVPLRDVSIEECVTLARDTASEVADRFDIPMFLYEEASSHPGRTRLEDIRRGGLEGLTARMRTPEWAPDYGPSSPHPTAGVTVIGARRVLIAYNVNLATNRIDVARTVAAAVRFSSGGLPHVKAMGVVLGDRDIVQVSMNLTHYEQTSVQRAFEAVTHEAQRLGVDVLESEIVGLVPEAALAGVDPADLKLTGFTPQQVLETRLRDTA